ncbi:hypothetical protein GCM10022224_006710 [Nonomuraea antimicrobica]|uniref:Lipoprotein n=1 Tax=Nonomuraea antimicrobica TaxID=561173 RepID=A0ABP7B3A5_9ACTN
MTPCLNRAPLVIVFRGMRWSWVVALVLALAACGGPGVQEAGTGTSPERTGRPVPEPVSSGPARRPVAEWLRVGGLAAPGLAAVRPPRLVVYADGLAIVDAAYELRLPPAEVETLVEALDHDLAGQPATASPRPGSVRVYDMPTTVLGVDGGDGMREVYVPYLEAGAARYDAALVTARDRLAGLADRVASQGRSYSADRVRLSAERVTAPAATAKPLPEGVPLPAEAQGHSASENHKDYKGSKAHAIARLIPGDGSWHVYRTSTGEPIALSWRYLLPHE